MTARFKAGVFALIALAAPSVVYAQGIVGGAEAGAARGHRAAGPVGAVVGGAVGAAVGGVVGGVRGVLGVHHRYYRGYRHGYPVHHHHRHR